MSERYRIIILPRASSDISRTFNYIEKKSAQNAVSVATRVIEAIDSLMEMPQRCKVYRSSRDPNHVVHALSLPPFIIYYRVIPSERIVVVLTIRHGAQRQPRRF
ncbi:MAG TPA: type II toxin-antitoxin system RelE/ParE family toxin [Tepidisphaeraceae bacterium]|nr:type II toxin-antitoxin system RelE/ParE family toxin [Tepidisphaeraceae bacterium]